MELMQTSVTAIILILIPLIIVIVVWLKIVGYLTRRSGLQSLQTKYPLQDKLGHDFIRLKIRSGRMGRMHFNKMLKVDLNETYLVIRFVMPFRLIFSGIQIPLSQIKHTDTRGKWMFKYHVFTIENQQIELYGKTELIVDRLNEMSSPESP